MIPSDEKSILLIRVSEVTVIFFIFECRSRLYGAMTVLLRSTPHSNDEDVVRVFVGFDDGDVSAS